MEAAEQHIGRGVGRSILVVDDEQSIRRTLEGIFLDEGFEVITASNGEEALKLFAQHTPSLVLLDIWLPGIDGISTLRHIRSLNSNTPIIMMSGHASISSAIEATRIGASEFIEKPLELSNLLETVYGLFDNRTVEKNSLGDAGSEVNYNSQNYDSQAVNPSIDPSVFFKFKRGTAIVPQKTLKSSAILYGQGLHTGRKSGLMLEPLPENSGIHFAGVGEQRAVPGHLDYVQSTGFATTIRLGNTQAGTIEHLMSAINAFGITNLLIKCNGEVPVMDGSALDFCKLFQDIGVKEQEGEWFDLTVTEKSTVNGKNKEEWISVEPADAFIIDYTLRYPNPIGEQRFVFTLDSIDNYIREIAPARTFGFVKDIGFLQRNGLALGGRFDNFVLVGETGPINTDLRFSDEFVRHKILDAIGDLYLFGRRLRGKVTASMTGHSDNVELLRAILQTIK